MTTEELYKRCEQRAQLAERMVANGEVHRISAGVYEVAGYTVRTAAAGFCPCPDDQDGSELFACVHVLAAKQQQRVGGNRLSNS